MLLREWKQRSQLPSNCFSGDTSDFYSGSHISNIGLDTDCSDMFFVGFLQFLLADAGVVGLPQN
jgi:hypothetical protein